MVEDEGVAKRRQLGLCVAGKRGAQWTDLLYIRAAGSKLAGFLEMAEISTSIAWFLSHGYKSIHVLNNVRARLWL